MVKVTPRLLALIPLAVDINLALGQFAAATALPVFLDTVGTILVAALAGLLPALLTGLLSQVVLLERGVVAWDGPSAKVVAGTRAVTARVSAALKLPGSPVKVADVVAAIRAISA